MSNDANANTTVSLNPSGSLRAIVRPYAEPPLLSVSIRFWVDEGMTLDTDVPLESLETPKARFFGDITDEETGERVAVVIWGKGETRATATQAACELFMDLVRRSQATTREPTRT